MLDYYQVQKEHDRKIKRVKRITLFILFCIVIITGGIIGFFHTKYAIIQSVSVQASNSEFSNQIKDAFYQRLNDQNSFLKMIIKDNNIVRAFAIKDSIIKYILDKFSFVNKADINVSILDGTVLINVTERDKYGLWCFVNSVSIEHQNKCYWFDKEGIVFLEGPNSQGQLLYKVIDSSREPINLGEKALSQEKLSVLLGIFDFIGKTGFQYRTLYFSDKDLDEITTSKDETPLLRFSLRNDPSYAIKAVNEFDEDKITKLKYINFTVPNRIYYQ